MVYSGDLLGSLKISKSKDGPVVTRRIVIAAADSFSALLNNACPREGQMLLLPGTYNYALSRPVYCTSVAVELVGNSAPDSVTGYRDWNVIATYKKVDLENPIIGKANLNVGTRMQPARKFVAIEQDHYPPVAPEGLGDYYNGKQINVTTDGIEGAEIQVPTEVMSITEWVSAKEYKDRLEFFRSKAGKINSSAFSGAWGSYEARCVLYLGFAMSQKGDDAWEFRHEFEYLPPEDLDVALDTVEGGTVSVKKRGQEYLWVRTGPYEHNGRKYERAALDAHVARPYTKSDFSGFDWNIE